MHRKLLPFVLWLCAICFCSIITGMGVVLLTGGRVFPPPFTPAPITRTLSPDLVLQSTAEVAPVSPSTIPQATLDLSGVLAAQPFASSTLSPSPLVTTTITSSAPPAPSTPSPSPSAATALTSTPAPTGTSAALPTVVDTVLVDAFDVPTGRWPVRTQPTSSTSYVNGQYQLQINGQPATSVSTAFEDESYRFVVDVTVIQGEAGLVFLADNQSAFYCFLVRQDGTYAIQRITTTSTTTLVDWTTSAALQRGAGVPNRVQVARVDGTVRFFANDVAEPFAEFELPSTTVVNHYGFVVASPDGRAQATFDNLGVQRLSFP